MKDWTKYIVLMFLLQFAGAVESSGQESSWLRNGTMWYYNYHEGMDDPRSGFIKCVISGDTIVEDRTCKILNKSLTKYNGEVIQLNKVILFYDTVNQRVYRRMDEKFTLLYDFGAAIGDTIAIPVGENNIIKDTLEIVISAKSNTIFNDTLVLETQHFSYIGPFDWYLGESAIEYIGSNAYFFPTSQLQCDAGCADQLRCYSNDQFNIRMPESEDCEYIALPGQSYQSIFANDTTKWIVFNCIPDAGETIGYFAYNDTVIDDKNWHVLHREILQSPGQSFGLNSTVCGYIREDTINGNCWFLSPDLQVKEETLFLDFDLEEGEYMKFITTDTSLSVDSILVVDVATNGGRKIITLDKFQFHCTTEGRIQFIEGIGATNGFYLSEPLEPSEVHMLACKFENSALVYSSTYASGNCFLSSEVAHRYSNEEYFHIYPNPSNTHFNIEIDPEILPVSYQIYSTDGCLVRTGEITRSVYTCNVEIPGIYYFEIYNNHFRSIRKVIQTNH